MNDGDERQPVILDKGCYWLICIPVPPDDVGWHWRGIIWVKGDSGQGLSNFKKNVAAIEEWAAKFMKCE